MLSNVLSASTAAGTMLPAAVSTVGFPKRGQNAFTCDPGEARAQGTLRSGLAAQRAWNRVCQPKRHGNRHASNTWRFRDALQARKKGRRWETRTRQRGASRRPRAT